jgi:hypothetical protein
MKIIHRYTLLLLSLFLLIVLAGCAKTTPTPVGSTPLPPPPTALTLPDRAPFTPTPEKPPVMASTAVAPEDTSTPETSETTAEEDTSTADTDVLGWAYVNRLQTSLRNTPGGKITATLHAGDRLDILGKSADGKWLKVRYQPDPDSAAKTGWVPVVVVRSLVDPKEITVVDTTDTQTEEPVATPSGEVVATGTVLARKLNLRSGPGIKQSIIDKLTSGQKISVLGRSDNSQWLQVQTADGKTGWAAARWIKLNKPVKELPVTGKALSAVPKPVPVSTAGSGAGGRIVFQESSGGPIYIMNADGTGLRQVATGLDPALSPDGSKIAFARWSGQKGIWILNLADGSERLGFGHEHARSPSWSPDGSTIVFERTLDAWECRETPLGCYTDQQIFDFFGGNDCRDFGWWGVYCIWDFPPHNTYFNYAATEINLNNEKIRDLASPPFAKAPYHSPVNNDVLMLIPEGIAVVSDTDNASLQRVVSNGHLGAPVFSPDGKYIYVSQQSGDHWDIWRYNADGSNPVALTRPPGIRDRAIHSVAPAPSPDGRSILFLTNREGDGSQWKLWIMNSDGSNQRPFAPKALANIHFKFDFGRERVLNWR